MDSDTSLDFTSYELELLHNKLGRIFFLTDCCKIERIIGVTHNSKKFLSYSWLLEINCTKDGTTYTHYDTYNSPRTLVETELQNNTSNV